MSMDGWERSEINTLHRRVEQLEKLVAELDARTGGLVKLGPQPGSADDSERRVKVTQRIIVGVKKIVDAPPVDRTQQTLTDGRPVSADHREIEPATGMQKAYVVLTAEERAKGFVRPVRQDYVHKTCGGRTVMARSIAETYARDPKFYNGTFCVECKAHLPLDQFVWDGTDEMVGS